MHTTNLRKVGGSVMLAVPPALLDVLQLQPGAKVGIAVQSGRLVVEPRPRPRYSLDELLAQCNPKARRSKQSSKPTSKPGSRQEREWLNSKPVGSELI
jgi:antitoxin ChpS